MARAAAVSGLLVSCTFCVNSGGQEIGPLEIEGDRLKVRWHSPPPVLEMVESLDGSWRPAVAGGVKGTGVSHISERAAGVPSTLSGCLTGITIAEPVSGVPRSLNDLARRANNLDAAAKLPCFFLHLTPRATFVH